VSRSPEPARAGGFTLLEVLVALGVLALVLTAVFRLFGSGARAVDHVRGEVQLALVAESLLERTRLDLDPAKGALSGRLPDGIDWRIEREPYVEPAAAPVPPPPDAAPAAPEEARRSASAGRETAAGGGEAFTLWRVRVIVEADGGGRFELATLRLADGTP
jgi:type II secretion system protein I